MTENRLCTLYSPLYRTSDDIFKENIYTCYMFNVSCFSYLESIYVRYFFLIVVDK